jgi:predicted nucleic acid-binding protein
VSLLLDATIWVASVIPESRFHLDALAVVESDRDFAALDLTLLEVANALGVKHGERRRAQNLCDLIVTLCRRRLVRIDPDLVGHALQIADEHHISAYDSAYVAAARREGWTLVSADHRDLVSKGLAVAPDAAV